MDSEPAPVTELLRLARLGDADARERLLPEIYAALHAIADGAMRRFDSSSTLQPTALVHEAYLKLFGGHLPEFADRDHFLCVSATAMRNLLVDRARARNARKRAGESPQSEGELDAGEILLLGFEDRAASVIDLHDALTELAQISPGAARVVELRFFSGATHEETARALGTSLRSVERDWRVARAWLFDRLGGEQDGR